MNPLRKDGGVGIPKITMTITFEPSTGDVEVNGPMGNPILYLGMLKMAEKVLDRVVSRAQEVTKTNGESRIQVL